jgi:hypothetical protein
MFYEVFNGYPYLFSAPILHFFDNFVNPVRDSRAACPVANWFGAVFQTRDFVASAISNGVNSEYWDWQ